jgi:hypothetical protein
MKKCFYLLALMLIFGWSTSLLAQNVNVTFQVDMSVKIATGSFNPATDLVTCPGGFNNWLNDPDNSGKVMSDLDNDSVYTITIAMAPSQTYGYKFNIGLGWDGKDETGENRSVTVGTTDLTVPISFYNDKKVYTGVSSTINFQVDMRLPAQGAFNPATNKVYVAGNFTDWGTGAIEMFDPNNDSIYTANVSTLTSGNLAIYKFIWSTGAASAGTWESPTEGTDIIVGAGNRIYGIHDGIDTVYRYWNNVNPNVTLADGNIFFQVDMSVPNELGVFNPDIDSVQIRGSFNSWNASQPAKSLLQQDPVDLNNWSLNVPFVQEVLNSTQAYKYFIKNPSTGFQYSNGGWEVPIGSTITSDRNRPVIFEGNSNQEVPLAYFENIHPDWVIPNGTTVQAEFSVDMSSVTGFVPATDTVYWIPRQPLFLAVHGFTEWTTNIRAYPLSDSNNDMIYTFTLELTGPDFNGFLYNYARSSAGELVQEDGSQQDCRVRFIAQNGARNFVSPFAMPQDVWTNGEKPEEEAPAGWTSVEEIPNSLVNTFTLDQNYPNPFNPSTKIRFNLPQAGNVNLSIYNLLGEKVAEVMNQEMTSGTFEVTFDGSNLSSGIYFYKINTNNYTATKKMILMK